MDYHSEGTAGLSSDLFDRYGRLRKEFYEHDFRKGSGVWGSELGDGDFLLFASLQIDRNARRKKAGTRAVKEILEAECHSSYAFVMPGYLTREKPPPGLTEEEEKAFRRNTKDIAIRFWRSLGFRRVGTSSWFAFTDDPEHPSKLLDALQDWDPPAKSRKEEELLPNRIVAVLRGSHDEKFSNLNGDTIPAITLKDLLPKDPEDPTWVVTDEHGNTVLHLAAEHSRPDDIGYILSKKPDLANVRNDEAFTPLEVLHNALEEERTVYRHWLTHERHRSGKKADQFRGFAQSSILSVGILTGVEVSDLGHVDAQRIKYGCTCGNCIDGFLSPRMRLALLRHAEEQHHILKEWYTESIDGFIGLPEHFTSTGAENCLPHSVTKGLAINRLVRKGLIDMWGRIVECLTENKIPSEENVMRMWETRRSRLRSGKGKAFLDSGGSVKVVADMLFRIARSRDEAAGTLWLENPYGKEISKLPCCRNDLEFEFVRGMCEY